MTKVKTRIQQLPDESEKTGKKDTRVQRLRERYGSHKPMLCYERALATTQAYRENEDDPVILRRAKAFKKTCETKMVFIQDDELIVGNAGCKPRAGVLCPEISCQWVEDELETLEYRDYDPYVVTNEAKKILSEEVLPYWKGNSLEEHVLAQLPEKTRRIVAGSNVITLSEKLVSGSGDFAPGIPNVLQKGFKGLKKEAEERLRELSPEEDKAAIDFLQSVCICCDGIITLAHRYAAEARRLAEIENSASRKHELLKIAETCKWVPANPARTFYEALQSLWFVQLGVFIEANAPSYSPCRMDQYLYPYFRSDIEAGLLTKKEAQELLDCLWIKLAENVWVNSYEAVRYFAGYMPYQQVNVGGLNGKGEDATNELSYMMLQASMDVRLFQPTISILVDSCTPDDLLEKACELAKLGDGHPSFFNIRCGIEMLKRKGIPLNVALEGGIGGCAENNTGSGSMFQWAGGAYYSFGSIAELALSDGYHHMTQEYIGARTGDPLNFKCYEDFYDAVKEQFRYLMKEYLVPATRALEECHAEYLPLPFASSCHDDCIKKSRDLIMGGARYNAGPGINGVGLANGPNSLAAVKKFVFDDKMLSMAELIKAIESNFEGFEGVRRLLLNRGPKWGNDDPYVDWICRDFSDFVVTEIESYEGRLGNRLRSLLSPVSSHVPMGLSVWALPDGRKAGTPLADSIASTQGTDRNGPTAVIKSVARMGAVNHTIASIFNMRFSPAAVEGVKGTKNIASLIRTYFELGGYHVQFNVVSSETLKAAQANPSEYQSLMVRVAGYSAYFVELPRELQDDIISRTEHFFS